MTQADITTAFEVIVAFNNALIDRMQDYCASADMENWRATEAIVNALQTTIKMLEAIPQEEHR